MSKTVEAAIGTSGIRAWFQRRTSVWKGVLIVIIAAILSEFPVIIRSARAASNIGSGAAAGALVYITVALGAVISIVTWAVTTMIIHGTSKLLRGKGSLRRFFAMNGFAFLPIVLQGLLSIVDVSLFPATTTSPLASQPVLEILLTQLNLLNLVALVLSTIAVMANYSLSRKRAATAVLVSVVILLVLGFLGIPLGAARSSGRGFSLFPRGPGGIRITPGG